MKKETTVPQTLPSATTSTVVPLLATAAPRALTVEERARVRAILDMRFDDSKGLFLDGYSDQRVGEETTLPWASVAQYRELAYGPLKIDPETQKNLAELENVKGDFVKLKADVLAASQGWGKLTERIDAALVRLADLAARFK